MAYNMELTADLFRIYIRDESEQANIAAINAITQAFGAVAGALFYKNAMDACIFCLAGSAFPIALSEEQWQTNVAHHLKENEVCIFDEWAPPGLDVPLRHWMSVALYTSVSSKGYVFLGKNGESWSAPEVHAFDSIAGVVAEVVTIRNKREAETLSRKKAEEALRFTEQRMSTFFDSSRDAMYICNPSGVFTAVNNATISLFELSSRNQIIGKNFSSFTVNTESCEFFMQKLAKNGYIEDHELMMKKKDGSTFFCLETANMVTHAEKNTIEIQGSIKDITQRIKSERDLWAANMELSDLNQKLQHTRDLMVQQEKLASIGQLAAGIAHEINNPLGFLKSNQSMLKEYFDTMSNVYQQLSSFGDSHINLIFSEKDVQYVLNEANHIFSESEEGYARIKRIISNLMAFSRQDKGTGFDLYDMNEGIESTLVIAWNEIKYVANIEKKLTLLPKIFARGGEVNQVILNIVVNAAQAITSQNRKEKGLITIETRLEDNYVVILISDDGPGIPEDIRTRLFDPFFTTKDPGKGTGLGLSISYDIIVTKHHGRILVLPSASNGACFRIEIPLIQPA